MIRPLSMFIIAYIPAIVWVTDKIIVIYLVLLRLGLFRLHKTFATDRGRPYTDTPFVIPPGILKSSQPIRDDHNLCMALDFPDNFVRYSYPIQSHFLWINQQWKNVAALWNYIVNISAIFVVSTPNFSKKPLFSVFFNQICNWWDYHVYLRNPPHSLSIDCWIRWDVWWSDPIFSPHQIRSLMGKTIVEFVKLPLNPYLFIVKSHSFHVFWWSNPIQSVVIVLPHFWWSFSLSLSHLQVLWWWMKGVWVRTSSKKMPQWLCLGALILFELSEARKKRDFGYEQYGFARTFTWFYLCKKHVMWFHSWSLECEWFLRACEHLIFCMSP